jgi:hypothetical protein
LKSTGILFAVWIAGVALACAQSAQQDQTGPQTQPDQPVQAAPATPAQTAQDQSAAADQYQGPSIISRDKSLIGERGGKLLDFRVWAGVSGVYDSGLVPVSTTATGSITNVSGSEGVEANFGASGSRQWQRDSLSLDYSGSFRHYVNNSSFDGIDQFLGLHYERVLSRRFTLSVAETGGISKLANGAYTYLPLTAIDLQGAPTNELFDSRTYYSQSRVALIFRKSARLSFSFFGQGYLVRRQSDALAGLNGYSGGADVAYRISKRQTLSLNYFYTFYDYQRTFGNANVQTVSAGYSIGLGRRWDASFSLGGSYAEARGEQQVAVNPAIVAIIGVSTITATFDNHIAVPYGAASIVRRFNRSALSVNASTGVSPGNGVYLTSRATSTSASYSYVGLRRWTMGLSFAYSELSSVGQVGLGKYDSYQTGAGATYRIGAHMFTQFRYDYRHYSANDNFYMKDSQRVSIGFAWSPGDLPLAIW